MAFQQSAIPTLSANGIDNPSWYSDERFTLPGLIIMSLWGVFGSNTLILLAGLKNIPVQLYEAVELDGGGAWAKFRYVTLSMLSPTLFYTLVLGVIAAVKTFEPGIFIKLNSTTTGTFLQVLVYSNAFAGGNSRMGCTILGWIMLAIVMVLTVLDPAQIAYGQHGQWPNCVQYRHLHLVGLWSVSGLGATVLDDFNFTQAGKRLIHPTRPTLALTGPMAKLY